MNYAFDRVLREREQRRRQMTGEGRAADLVLDDGELIARGPGAQDGGGKAGAAGAEQPRGADDRVRPRRGLGHRQLARELATTVFRSRSRGVGFEVGRALLAREHVVGGDVDDPGAGVGGGPRDGSRTGAVDGERLSAPRLRAIDVGPRRAVEDGVRPRFAHRGLDGLGIADVELGVPERGQLVAGDGSRIRDVAPEHSRCTRDQELHRRQG